MNQKIISLPCISIKQPAATLIVTGEKTVENRTWKPPKKYGDSFWLLIHSSASVLRTPVTKDPKRQAEIEAECESFPRGCIVGAVKVTGVETFADGGEAAAALACDPWAYGPYCWRCGEVIQLDNPVPYKGQLGIYTVKIRCKSV